MSIPVPPNPNAPMTDPSGQPSAEWDKWFNTIQTALNNTGGSILQPNAGGTGQGAYTDGQLLIGNTTGSTLQKNTLTAGTNIAITNGPGSITIALNGSLATNVGGTGQSSYTDGQILIGDSTNNGLDKTTLTAGTGITVTNGHGSITISISKTNIINKVINQVFTSSGTYTPTSGMVYCVVEALGGGASGSAQYNSGFYTIGTGGGSGGYSRSVLTSTTVSTSQTVTIGTGATGTHDGKINAGGSTSLGSLVIANGGVGNLFRVGTCTADAIGAAVSPGGFALPAGGAVGTGDIIIPGSPGGAGFIFNLSAVTNLGIAIGGQGGIAPIYGNSNNPPSLIVTDSTGISGNAPVGYGSGGSGGINFNDNTNSITGGPGSPGILLITEFCSV